MAVVIKDKALNRDSRSIKEYMKTITNIPVLTKEEEFEYGVLAMSGDERAKEKLITHNLKFVVSVAKEYYNKKIGIEDLINEGNLGLIEAANRFDPHKGFKFISYAVFWIEQSIRSYIADNAKSVSMPTYRGTRLPKFKRMVSVLEQNLSRDVYLDELLEIGMEGFGDTEIKELYEISKMSIPSLDSPINEDGFKFGDTIAGNSYNKLLSLFENDNEDNVRIIKYAFKYLNEKERTVLTHHFGLDGEVAKMDDDIGEIINKRGKDTVGRIRRDAIIKLRARVKEIKKRK